MKCAVCHYDEEYGKKPIYGVGPNGPMDNTRKKAFIRIVTGMEGPEGANIRPVLVACPQCGIVQVDKEIIRG